MHGSSDSGLHEADVRTQWGVRIPLRDGVELNATLYLPANHAEPGPAIVTLTPYIGQTYHDRGIYFALHGYPFLTVDVRGRGNSSGTFRPFIDESRDAYDVVEWVARQPFCNGRVSMWGGSYGGYVQWAAAKEFPEHLTAIVPVASPHFGTDFPGRSNMPMPYMMQWLTLVWGRTSQDKLFWNKERYWGDKFRQLFEAGAPYRTFDEQLGCPSPTFQEWVAHPRQDSYWDAYNPTPQHYARMSLPVLTITGIYDGDQPGALMHYRQHMDHASEAAREKHYLIIGPWDHAGTRAPAQRFCGLEMGPESLVDLAKLHLDWYAWTLREGPKPAFLKNKVAYYVPVADRWRYADSLDAVTLRSEPFYLNSSSSPTDVFHSGMLGDGPSSAGVDSYVYDPCEVSLAELESSVDPESRADQRMTHAARGRLLIYHTEPFAEDLEVTGFFKFQAWLSIDQPDTDFRVAVYDVALDGSVVLLTTDYLRARYRTSLREEQLIETTQPLSYEFNRFTFTSRLIRKGHRLRLVFGPSHSIYSQKNYNSGGVVATESMRDARAVTVRLFHDREHPSALHVPLGHPER
ncbi:MAG TPA: CocE/NonD family hydrolase [Steroidobacter sp.]